MRSSSASLCTILTFAFPLAAQTPTVQTSDKPASVQGTVTDSVTGAPVPRAHVILQGGGEDGKPVRYGAASSADGRFSFTGVAPGNYSVDGDRIGYVSSQSVSRGRTRANLQAGDSKTGITIQLTPMGAITGRVTDSEGEPIEFASVSAESGRGAGSGTTDEKGQFRIGGLAPGKYRVKAARAESFGNGRPEIRTDGTAEVHNASTYYPGVLPAKEARQVSVGPGGETMGIDIQLVRVPFVRVSGKVVDFPRNVENQYLEVMQMVSNDGPGGYSSNGYGNQLKPDGSFEVWRLDPGKYTLAGQWSAPNGEQVRTVGAEIEVAGSHIDNIELRVVADSDIPGRLEFEDDEAKQIPRQNGPEVFGPERTVVLAPVGEFENNGSQSSVDADGAFQLKKVAAGKYRVQVTWGTSYVKSVRLGTTQIEGSVLDLSKGSGGADLSLLMAAATSSISGTVQADGGNLEGTMVVLTGGDELTGFNPQYEAVAADGKYTILNLPPGTYKIVAVAEGDLSFEGNKIPGYEDQMVSVKIGAKDKVTQDLKRRAPTTQ